jgi:crotonobetaine/carnitine-CoA ligase
MGKAETWSLGQQDTVIAALDRAVAAHPERVLLDFAGELYTYGQVDQLSTRLANSLASLGIQPGQTVVTMLDNNIDAVISWLAVNKLCAVSVPVNTALRGEFLRHQVADAGAPLVICESEYVDRIAAVADGLPEVRLVLQRGSVTNASCGKLPLAPLDAHRGADDTPPPRKPNPWELASLIYTSGTTGPSKGCMISYNFMCNLARLQLRAGPATADDVTITPLPLFHMNALAVGILSNILVGARVAIVPRFSYPISGPRWSAAAQPLPRSSVAWGDCSLTPRTRMPPNAASGRSIPYAAIRSPRKARKSGASALARSRSAATATA